MALHLLLQVSPAVIALQVESAVHDIGVYVVSLVATQSWVVVLQVLPPVVQLLQKPALHGCVATTQSPTPVLVLQLLHVFGLPEHEFEFGQSLLAVHDFAL